MEVICDITDSSNDIHRWQEHYNHDANNFTISVLSKNIYPNKNEQATNRTKRHFFNQKATNKYKIKWPKAIITNMLTK